MSTPALNSVYKFAGFAIEEAALTENASVADLHVHISLKCMTSTPFAVNGVYTVQDNAWATKNIGTSTTPATYANVAALVTAKTLSVGDYFYSSDGADTTDVALHLAKGGAVAVGDTFKVTSASTCVYCSGNDPHALQNSEKVIVTSIAGLTATPLTDGTGGYLVSGQLAVLGLGTNGWAGGLINSYSTTQSASVLCPGVEIAIQSSDINCRIKTIADAPKIEFDDESSRMATGDEGRDKSIAGARGAEITLTEKIAWGGSVSTEPKWSKLMRAMAHQRKTYHFGVTACIPSSYATVAALVSALSLVAGNHFITSDGSDTTDSALAAAKGSAISQGDMFVVLTASTCAYVLNTVCGQEYLPLPWANEVTATIWILTPENGANPTQTIYRYRGAHGGNGSSLGVSKIGDVYLLTGKFSSPYVGTLELSYANAKVLTSPETKTPEVMLLNTVSVPSVYGTSCVPSSYATIAALVSALSLSAGSRFYSSDGSDVTNGALATAKGSAVVIGDSFVVLSGGATCSFSEAVKNVQITQWNLDFGGVVNPYEDQSTSTGHFFYATQDRAPKFICNPLHPRKSLDDIDFMVTNGISGRIIVQSAPTSPHITVEVCNAQLLNPAKASREGYENTNRTYNALRNNLGTGAVETALPDGCMYGVLIGSRS